MVLVSSTFSFKSPAPMLETVVMPLMPCPIPGELLFYATKVFVTPDTRIERHMPLMGPRTLTLFFWASHVHESFDEVLNLVSFFEPRLVGVKIVRHRDVYEFDYLEALSGVLVGDRDDPEIVVELASKLAHLRRICPVDDISPNEFGELLRETN